MAVFVLGAWLVQAGVGVLLLSRWVRHRPRGAAPAARRGGSRVVLGHLALAVGALFLWSGFTVTGEVLLGWSALGALTLGNVLGDTMLVRRSRRMSRSGGSAAGDYARAVGRVLAGRFDAPVTVHALGAGVVYFGALAACLAA
ncbi:MAG: hypothetical protein IE926_11560 [Micrococcales bacterium]|nr:hypothetical protein [Micrococcales bacterium]